MMYGMQWQWLIVVAVTDIGPVYNHYTRADPELLLGGVPTPSRGCLPNILIKFSEKPYEMKRNFGPYGGARQELPPLDPPLLNHSSHNMFASSAILICALKY